MSVPSPNTPWNPNVNSPGQPASSTADVEAYMRKIQELQIYVPLLARMLDKINRGGQVDDKTKNDQSAKLKSLYNVLTSKSKYIVLWFDLMCGDSFNL